MQDDSIATRRWCVRGRVQGVGFRAATRAEAARLGLGDGWAVNLADGSVEVCARGPSSALRSLADWLREGPRFARVDALEELSPPSTPPAGFSTRHG